MRPGGRPIANRLQVANLPHNSVSGASIGL
jgi:hypothetical protein